MITCWLSSTMQYNKNINQESNAKYKSLQITSSNKKQNKRLWRVLEISYYFILYLILELDQYLQHERWEITSPLPFGNFHIFSCVMWKPCCNHCVIPLLYFSSLHPFIASVPTLRPPCCSPAKTRWTSWTECRQTFPFPKPVNVPGQNSVRSTAWTPPNQLTAAAAKCPGAWSKLKSSSFSFTSSSILFVTLFFHLLSSSPPLLSHPPLPSVVTLVLFMWQMLFIE